MIRYSHPFQFSIPFERYSRSSTSLMYYKYNEMCLNNDRQRVEVTSHSTVEFYSEIRCSACILYFKYDIGTGNSCVELYVQVVLYL